MVTRYFARLRERRRYRREARIGSPDDVAFSRAIYRRRPRDRWRSLVGAERRYWEWKAALP
jgi:hypothetical protein